MGDGGGTAGAGQGTGLLRSVDSKPQSSFVELFFDLVVVFALNRVVVAISPGLQSDSHSTQWRTLAEGMLLVLPLFWVWTITAYGTARFDPVQTGVQLVILATALGVLLLGAAIPQAFDSASLIFAGLYVVLQAGRALALGLMLRRHPLRQLYLGAFGWFCLSAVPWLAGAFTAGLNRIVLWSLAILIDYGSARLGWPMRGLGRRRVTAWGEAPEHLADRYRQLVMISLGEAILAVGIGYTSGAGFGSLTATLELLIAFLTTVLLWRIYIYKSGALFGEAVRSARHPAGLGRVAATAHALMIMGIVSTAVGHDVVQHHPTGRAYLSWLAVIVGGPALYLVGRALLERVVFSRVSLPRVVGVAALLLLTIPLAFAPALAAVAVVPVVLLVITIADIRRAAAKPREAPLPGG